MDKQHFIEIVSHFLESSDEDATQLIALTEKFPYSQLLHALAARAAKEHHRQNQQNILQLAAVHCTDRTVLKEVMSTAVGISVPQMPATEYTGVTTPAKPSGKVDYATELMHDLERLQELRHNFETLFADTEGSGKTTSPSETEKQEVPTEAAVPKPKKTKSGLSKRERLIQLSKQLASSPAEIKSTQTDSGKSKNKVTSEDPLIEEIKEKKKQLTPENEKTKEQIEIIDQFIKSRSASTTPKTIAAQNEDLSSALKSGEFGDNVISETLAEILIRQGKKEKAIEVYKKLIWKFPQKKAYFAAQIEDLKK